VIGAGEVSGVGQDFASMRVMAALLGWASWSFWISGRAFSLVLCGEDGGELGGEGGSSGDCSRAARRKVSASDIAF